MQNSSRPKKEVNSDTNFRNWEVGRCAVTELVNQNLAEGKIKKQPDLHQRATKKLWDLLTLGIDGSGEDSGAKNRKTGWSSWSCQALQIYFTTAAEDWLIQICSLNRIKLRVYGLGNPSRVGSSDILNYGGAWVNVFTLNAETLSLNPLCSHFRELAARIIPSEKGLGESGGFQGIHLATSQYSEDHSQQAHPHSQNVQSVFKWPTEILDLAKYSFRVGG